VNLDGLVVVSLVVAGGLAVIAGVGWAIMLLARSSIEGAYRLTMLLIRYSVERNKRSSGAMGQTVAARLPASDAPWERARRDSWPLRAPVLSGARHGGE
jgi:hypothetical protein